MDLIVKTAFLILSSWLVAVAAVAQSTIGMYSQSLWANTNLNVNRTLESGASGKLLGYKSTGVIGLLDPSGGIPEAPTDGQTYGRRGSDTSWQLVTGGSGRSDVVIGQDTVAALTNNIMPDLNGLERVIVSDAYRQSWQFFQAITNAEMMTQSNNIWDATGTHGQLVWLSESECSVELVGSEPTLGLLCVGSTEYVNKDYVIRFALRSATPTTFGTSNTQDNEVWNPTEISTNWTSYTFSFRSLTTNGVRINLNKTTTSKAWFRDLSIYGTPFDAVNGMTVFPSLSTNLVWASFLEKRIASVTITDPELVYAVSPVVPLLSVESIWAPNGIALKQVFLKTEAASTYSLILNQRPDPVAAGTNVITVATSASAEAQSAALTNVIYAGEILCWTLPATDVKWIQPTLIYTVLP